MAAPEYFANLVLGCLQLLIPQSDIYALEPALDMAVYTGEGKGCVGQLKQGGIIWPLYAFSSDLTLLQTCPEAYHIAILLKNVEPLYGLLCEQVNTVAGKDLSLYPVPSAMQCPGSPLSALALYGREVRGVSSAAALSRYLL